MILTYDASNGQERPRPTLSKGWRPERWIGIRERFTAAVDLVRLAVYVDDVYRQDGEVLTAGLAFPLFAAGLSDELEAVTLLGRLDPRPGRTHHVVPADVAFIPLPYYAKLSQPLDVARSMTEALRRFWTVLGRVDAIWLLGPHPLSLAVVALAALRRRRIVLGVREHTTQYAAYRHPDRRLVQVTAALLERAWRRLARVLPMVAVGPELAAAYAQAPRLLELAVTFVEEDDIVSPGIAAERTYAGEIRLLSVTRLEPEKNPLLLADVLAALTAAGYNVRLIVCGEGPLLEPLVDRAHALGIADRVDLLGYVPVENGLRDVYLSSHVFLHTSWTEGIPQVLFEAFAARLPTVATDVGGVTAIANDSAVVVPPGDPEGAAAAIQRIITDAQFRQRLSNAGGERVRLYTREVQLRRLAHWLQEVAADQRSPVGASRH